MSDDTKKNESDEAAIAPIDVDEKKGGKKLILMILVPILLLAGGGAGLYFTGMLDKMLGKEAPAEGEDGAPAKAKNEKSKGPPADVAFLKIPDMIVNLSSDGGQPRYLRLSIQLELANAADMAAVEKVMPRVVDQFQTYLRELRVQDLRGSKGMYRLQMELLSRVNAAAAPTQVKDVLFQEILIQ
jgi:flagellar FliL protein